MAATSLNYILFNRVVISWLRPASVPKTRETAMAEVSRGPSLHSPAFVEPDKRQLAEQLWEVDA